MCRRQNGEEHCRNEKEMAHIFLPFKTAQAAVALCVSFGGSECVCVFMYVCVHKKDTLRRGAIFLQRQRVCVGWFGFHAQFN